jgi:hypothetical protein
VLNSLVALCTRIAHALDYVDLVAVMTCIGHKMVHDCGGLMCRDEVLTMQVLESELKRECALLALVDDNATRVLCSTAVPLQHLVPGVHYNLKLAIAGGAVLLITVLVESAPWKEMQQLQQVSSGVGSVLLVRLASCSIPLCPTDGNASGECLGTVMQIRVESNTSSFKSCAENDDKCNKQSGHSPRESPGDTNNSPPRSSNASSSPTRPSNASKPQSGPGDASDSLSTNTSTISKTQKDPKESTGSAVSVDGTVPQAPIAGKQASEGPHLLDRQGLEVEAVYIEVASHQKNTTELLESCGQRYGMLQGSIVPIVGTRRPDQQLWPITHGVLQALPKVDSMSFVLVIMLYQLHMQGTGMFLGCCKLPLTRVLASEGGALVVSSDLLSGGPRVLLFTFSATPCC